MADPYQCPTCGQTHRGGCHAHKKPARGGGPCHAVAQPGFTVCRHHGAGSPVVKAAAERRVAEAEATRWMLEHIKDAAPLQSLGDVYDELLAVAGVARTMRLVMQDRVSTLQTTGYEGHTGEQVKADVVLLERALDRSAKVTDLIARLNIDERKQRLTERDGALVATAIRGILEDLQLTSEQQARVPVVVAARLRALAGEGGTP